MTDQATPEPVIDETTVPAENEGQTGNDNTSPSQSSWDNHQAEIVALQKKLEEQEAITKRAQYDYINLKMDFDRRSRQKEEEAKTAHIDTLISSVKKFLPFVESLRKSLETIPEDQKENALAKGVEMTYNKFVQTLASMHIKQIDALWLVPDMYMHEAVSTQETSDEALKWKIVAEFERWFVYDDGQTKKVVTTSKVVVGQ